MCIISYVVSLDPFYNCIRLGCSSTAFPLALTNEPPLSQQLPTAEKPMKEKNKSTRNKRVELMIETERKYKFVLFRGRKEKTLSALPLH